MSNMVCLVNKKIQYGKTLYIFKREEDAPEMPEEVKELFKSSGYIKEKNTSQTKKTRSKTRSKSKSKPKPAPMPTVGKQEVLIDPEQHIIEEEQVFNNTFRKEDNE